MVLSFGGLLLLLLLDLEQKRPVDMGKNTTKGDGGTDEGVEFLVTTNGELQVAGRDALDLKVLGGVLRQKWWSVHVARIHEWLPSRH